ncbi:MAG: hypothetical protein ACPKPY_02345 [Nitrososphaeraceae archaeon]
MNTNYFNKNVKSLDSPDVGHVVRQAPDLIVVFGGKNHRYDIPIQEVTHVGNEVLIELSLDEIEKKYKRNRADPLPTSRDIPMYRSNEEMDYNSFEQKYRNALFNKKCIASDHSFVGHIMKETDDAIIIFGNSDYRYDIPKSHVLKVGSDVTLNIDFPEIFQYKVDWNASLPTGESLEKINQEAYPEYYHGPKDDENKKDLLYPK